MHVYVHVEGMFTAIHMHVCKYWDFIGNNKQVQTKGVALYLGFNSILCHYASILDMAILWGAGGKAIFKGHALAPPRKYLQSSKLARALVYLYMYMYVTVSVYVVGTHSVRKWH